MGLSCGAAKAQCFVPLPLCEKGKGGQSGAAHSAQRHLAYPLFRVFQRAGQRHQRVLFQRDRAALARQAKGPRAHANFPFDIWYGYHFDATLLGQFLGRKAVEVAPVKAKGRKVKVRRLADLE